MRSPLGADLLSSTAIVVDARRLAREVANSVGLRSERLDDMGLEDVRLT